MVFIVIVFVAIVFDAIMFTTVLFVAIVFAWMGLGGSWQGWWQWCLPPLCFPQKGLPQICNYVFNTTKNGNPMKKLRRNALRDMQ